MIIYPSIGQDVYVETEGWVYSTGGKVTGVSRANKTITVSNYTFTKKRKGWFDQEGRKVRIRFTVTIELE